MYLGIDIGGTKTLLASFKADGTLLDTVKFKTPKEYKDFLLRLRENIPKIQSEPWKLVAVAAPGSIDHKKGVAMSFGNLPWSNIPVSADVQAIVHCPVLLENDAKTAGLSEARLLKPIRHKTLYITVSTGIGGAILIDGKLDRDLDDGEVGWMLHEREGKLVTWESFASGKAIVRRFGKRASDINDPHVWRLISHDLALGLIDISAIIQPDIIIIGGGVGSNFHKFKKPLNEEMRKYETRMVEAPPVVGARHAEEAVIFGCYQLIKDYERAAR